MSVQTDLIEAIKNKRNVRFNYAGHERKCSPHAIGYKKGKINCHVYQFGGMSSSGLVSGNLPSDWRCMDVAKINSIEFIDGTWHTSDNHSVPANCIDDFIAQVSH